MHSSHIDRTQKVTIRCTLAQSTKLSSPKREIAKRTVDSLHEFPLVKLGVEENAKESGLDLSVRVWRRNDTNLAKAIQISVRIPRRTALLYLGGSGENISGSS